ncbi:MAG: hypothetical protein K8U57_05640 [Planctomycetes bacterium]|nr:hypothetical protein [Planctomycetota bacterium]
MHDRVSAKRLWLEVIASGERRKPSELPAADNGTSGDPLKSAVGFASVIFGDGFGW